MITILGGVNGAGKSSVFGSFIRQSGDYFNPDEYAQSLLNDGQAHDQQDANAQAWHIGKDLLLNAIRFHRDLSIESTLGGNTITRILLEALSKGVPVRVAFCGLQSPQLHLDRVAARVKNGGHPIPEEKIHERWINSVHNMCRLIEAGCDVDVWDNSATTSEGRPAPVKVFSLRGSAITGLSAEIPDWSKPIAAAALKRI